MSGLAAELAHYDADVRRIIRTARRLAGSEAPLAAAIGRRQMAGGKRLRAVVALLCGRLCGQPDSLNDKIAVGIEIIHMATLLHDDVVDDAPMRRRRSTANRMYGNAAAVLVGDFLYSRASQIFAEIGSLPLLEWIARATNGLAEGEIMQLERAGKLTDEPAYFEIIRRKTANLFESAAAAPALAAGRPAAALAAYGRHLGTAFQLIDDCLDYAGSDGETGKKIGADFAEGKMTLPAILALAKTGAAARRRMLAGWKARDGAAFAETLELVRSSGALEETRARAAGFAQKAADALRAEFPEKSRQNLAALARASVDRRG